VQEWRWALCLCRFLHCLHFPQPVVVLSYKQEVAGSSPALPTINHGSSPETWVTECTGHMGNLCVRYELLAMSRVAQLAEFTVP
jgi:hypothetical protein